MTSGRLIRRARRALIPVALICLWLAAAVLPVSAGRLGAARAETVSANRTVTLRVGWFDQPGYMEMDDHGQPGGYLYEYLQSISQQTGWQYTYVSGTRSNLYRQLTKGQIDLMGLLFVDQYQSDKVLMSNLTAGVDQTTLFTMVDSPLCENDYSSFNGLRIAVSLNSSSSSALFNLAQSKGFTPHLVYFGGEEDIKNALRRGVVDAGVIDSYRTQSEFRSLATFEPRNFYFGVTDTRPDIARKLNDAMAGILATNTTFNDQLSERYLHEVTDHFSITDEEQAFIAEHPTLTAAYGPSWVPLMKNNDADPPSGVAVSLLNNLAAMTGFKIQYVPLVTADDYDLLCCAPQDYELANQKNLRLSNAYLTLSMTLVTGDGAETATSAALPEGFTLSESLPSTPGTLVYYPTAQQCLNAVLSGEQPAALLNNYTAENLLHNVRYDGLKTYQLNGASVGACFAVPSGMDARLLSILNKMINHTSDAEMNDYIISAVLEDQPINLTTIASQMPIDVILLFSAGLVLVLTLMILLVLHNMRGRRERARTIEIVAFLEYAQKANEDIWEVNVLNSQRWRYRVENGAVQRVPLPAFTEEIIRKVIHPEDLQGAFTHIKMAMTQQFFDLQRRARFDFRMCNDDTGDFRWCRVTVQSMLPSKEHPRNLMVFINDVEETVQAEEKKNAALRQALEDARAASDAKSEFTAYISHEIRSPLNAVLGYLTLARSRIHQPEALEDCFVKSEFAANHLLQLINDVLDMGSIENGKLQMAQQSFSLRTLLDTLSSIYSAQARNRGIHYSVESGEIEHTYLIGDELRVKQVIVNLISNAMKFTPRGGSVTVYAEQTHTVDNRSNLRFTVTDTGIGMTEEFQTRLFNAYVQQDATIAGRFGGSGLGLSISKRLVDLMEGTIGVQSTSGKGTIFTVMLTFPIDEAEHRKDALDVTPDAFVGKRLLLAEDNDMNMEIATELLKQSGGFVIDPVTNGQEAVERFSASPAGTYDAILMDVRMPVMDGYEATRVIRASAHPDARTVPIFAMTANAFAEDVQQALAVGMTGHIAKPIDFHQVLEKLANVFSDQRGVAAEEKGAAPES